MSLIVTANTIAECLRTDCISLGNKKKNHIWKLWMCLTEGRKGM